MKKIGDCSNKKPIAYVGMSFLRMSNWEEALGQTKDTLERLCLSAALKTHQYPHGGAGGDGWGEGGLCLGCSRHDLNSNKKKLMDGWMGCSSGPQSELFLYSGGDQQFNLEKELKTKDGPSHIYILMQKVGR